MLSFTYTITAKAQQVYEEIVIAGFDVDVYWRTESRRHLRLVTVFDAQGVEIGSCDCPQPGETVGQVVDYILTDQEI